MATKLQECKFYCTATGPWTSTKCMHCDMMYCDACKYGSHGPVVVNRGRGLGVTHLCPNCKHNPKVAKRTDRPTWHGSDGRNYATKVKGQPHCVPVGPNRKAQQEYMLGPNAILLNMFRTEDAPPMNEEQQPQRVRRKLPPTPQKHPDENVFDRLTDPKLYSGTHKHRFTPDGRGRGMFGRRDDVDGVQPRSDALLVDGKQTLVHPKHPLEEPDRDPPKKDGSVFDRLTNPKYFSGTHKHRFDRQGNGLGPAGRRDDTLMQRAIAGEVTITRDDDPEMDIPGHWRNSLRYETAVELEASQSPVKKTRKKQYSTQDAFEDEVMKSGVFSRLTKVKQTTVEVPEFERDLKVREQFNVDPKLATLHGTRR